MVFLSAAVASATEPSAIVPPPDPVSLPSNVTDIVFAVRRVVDDGHWYANFGYYAHDPNDKLYRDGGKLCRLNARTGKLTVLLDDPKGGVRDPQVSYDGKKILFSYRKGGTGNYNLYEIGTDADTGPGGNGQALRQLSDGP